MAADGRSIVRANATIIRDAELAHIKHTEELCKEFQRSGIHFNKEHPITDGFIDPIAENEKFSKN
jgi:hypothetical protein